jgi:hypothetical protein
VGHYPFSSKVADTLVARGFDERDVRRFVEKLFLGPDATERELLSVATAVLIEKAQASRDTDWPPATASQRQRILRPSIPPLGRLLRSSSPPPSR